MDFLMTRDLNHIYENIWLGDMDQAANLKLLQESKITHILVCGKEQKFHFPGKFEYLKLDLYNYRWGADLSGLWDEAVAFMKQGNCFVHCAAGMHRAPTFVLAYLIGAFGMTLDEAFQLTKQRRPIIDPPKEYLQQLKAYADKLGATSKQKNLTENVQK